MKEAVILKATRKFISEELAQAEGGHDWFHIERVLQNAREIGAEEDVDMFVVELAVLLHDVADPKFFDGDETRAPRIIQEFLSSQQVPPSVTRHVINIVNAVSFKGGNFPESFWSAELAVVQDADRLDALGAVGIARAFNYGGFKNRRLFDPEIKPRMNMTKEEYRKSSSPTLNHFFEKLFLLKDKMNTPKGKVLAEERHKYLLDFVDRFLKESGVNPQWPL